MNSGSVSESEVLVLLLVGSNIDPRRNLIRALESLERVVEVVAGSRVLESQPVGSPGAPEFLNAGLAIRTSLTAAELKFDVLRNIEEELGRERSEDKNAPRTIDIDIGLFGRQVIEDPESGIHIPDPDIASRHYAAAALADIAPDAVHPVIGKTLREIAIDLSNESEFRVVAESVRALDPG